MKQFNSLTGTKQGLSNSQGASGAVYRAVISRGIYIRPVLLGLACWMLMDVDRESGAGPVFGLLGLTIIVPLFLLRCTIHRHSRHYVVKPSGLKISVGMWATIHRAESFLPRSQIESVSAVQGFCGRVFGYGHVLVTATGSRTVLLRWVRDPSELAVRIEHSIG